MELAPVRSFKSKDFNKIFLKGEFFKMKRKALLMVLIPLLMISVIGITPVTAKAPTPSLAEYDVQLTYFSPYNSEYKLDDPLIVGTSVDMLFFESERGSTALDLGKSVWESNFPTILSNSAYSETLGNATYNAGTVDGHTINTEATSNAAETLITFKSTSNGTAVAQYAQAISQFAYDGNGDGDYVDTADKHYLPHDENIHIIVNNECTFEGTGAATIAQFQIAFKTTTTTDYTIYLKYTVGNGDAGWDFTTANGATFDYFDVSGQPLVITLSLAQILDADSESVNILGTNELKFRNDNAEATKYMIQELKNFAIYTAMPAFTDDHDGNSNWDMDGSDEYFSGIDQTDYIFTTIAQDTTDTFDNSQEFLLDQSSTITTCIPARYLYFTGAMSIYPTGSWTSTFVESGKWLTKESLTFDTRALDDLITYANVLSVSTWKLNMTMDRLIMWDTDNYENNLVSFTDQGNDKVETLRSAWTTSIDDAEVTYDNSDPSTTDGDLDAYYLEYYTASDQGSQNVEEDDDGVVVVTPSDSGSGDVLLGVGVIAFITIVTVFYIKTRK